MYLIFCCWKFTFFLQIVESREKMKKVNSTLLKLKAGLRKSKVGGSNVSEMDSYDDNDDFDSFSETEIDPESVEITQVFAIVASRILPRAKTQGEFSHTLYLSILARKNIN